MTFSRDDDNPARMPDRAPDRAPEKNPDRPRKTGLGCGVYALFAYAIIVFTSICDSVSSQGAPGIYGPVGQPAAGVISVALMLVYVRLSPRIDILGFLGKSKVSEAKKQPLAICRLVPPTMLALNAEWAEAPPVSGFFSHRMAVQPFCAA